MSRKAMVLVAIVGLLLVCAVSAGAAAAAEPFQPPSYGFCQRTFTEPKYGDTECTTPATEMGGYFWYSVNPGEYIFFEKGKTILHLAGTEVTCKGVEATGVFTSVKTFSVPVKWMGCTVGTTFCTTAGAGHPGEIDTSMLHALLGLAQSKKGTHFERVTALELAPEEEGAPFATFACGATEVTMRGALTARTYIKKRINTLEAKIVKAQQAIASLEGVAATPLEASMSGGGYEPVTVKSKISWPYQEYKISSVISGP